MGPQGLLKELKVTNKIDFYGKKVEFDTGHRVPKCRACRKSLIYPYYISGKGFYYHLACVGERSKN